jgi:hypothetical protein
VASRKATSLAPLGKPATNAEGGDNSPSSAQRGVLTQDVRSLRDSFYRTKGKVIARGEIRDELWDAWVAEGIISLPDYVSVNPVALRRGAKRKKAI